MTQNLFKFESMEEDYFNGPKESAIRPMMVEIKNNKTGEIKSVTMGDWLGKLQFNYDWDIINS